MAVADSIARSHVWQGFSDLADVGTLLDAIDMAPLVEALTGPPRTGRKPFSRRPILRAYLVSYTLGIPNTSMLVRRLDNDPLLRSTCGFTDKLPNRSTFSRVFQMLAERYIGLVEECCAQVARQLANLLPDFGKEIAVDSTTVPAYSNPNRRAKRNPAGPSDPDASWTKKHSAQNPSREEWVFGYKVHTIADANHDLPISMIVTTAKQHDSPMLRPLIEKAESEHTWLQVGVGSLVIADRGYDSKTNNEYIHRRGGAPVIHKRKPQTQGGLHDGIYTTDGVPTCLGKQEMEYVRTDSMSGHHLYRCPPSGCSRLGKTQGYVACGDESWEKPEQDIRLFGGRIRRASSEWAAQYAKRWSIERIFSRWKHPGRLESHCYLGLTKVRLHATLQMLASLAEIMSKQACV